MYIYRMVKRKRASLDSRTIRKKKLTNSNINTTGAQPLHVEEIISNDNIEIPSLCNIENPSTSNNHSESNIIPSNQLLEKPIVRRSVRIAVCNIERNNDNTFSMYLDLSVFVLLIL